jgi:hypothetical protein
MNLRRSGGRTTKSKKNARKKKSIWEEKWENMSSPDLFGDIDDVVIVKPRLVVEEKKQPVVEPKPTRLQRLARATTDLEITPSGLLRSDAEIVGIERARIRSRKEKKKNLLRERREESKRRDLIRSGKILEEKKESQESLAWKKEQELKKQRRKLINSSEAEKPKRKFSKKERLAFRAMKKKQKDDKKERRRLRVARRNNPQTESGFVSCLPQTPFNVCDLSEDNELWSWFRQLSDFFEGTDTLLHIVNYCYQISHSQTLLWTCL